MGNIVQAPLCRNGQAKNHDSIIEGKSVTWKDGIAELSDEQWEAVKGIPGYNLIKAAKAKKETSKTEPEKEEAEKEETGEFQQELPKEQETATETVEDVTLGPEEQPKETEPETEPKPKPTTPKKKNYIGKMVTINSTANDIKKFAAKQLPPIDLGKSKTKSEMLEVIAKALK